jgi:predicted DNA-binding protein YlxM (UPF0122 family)
MMAKKKSQISKKQRKVLNGIFNVELSIDEILEKYNVSISRYASWFLQAAFATEFTRRLNLAWINSKVILARYSTLAVSKLITLTKSESDETIRKACNDILTYQFKELQLVENPQTKLTVTNKDNPEEKITIPDEMHSSILKYLAENKE